MIPLRLLFIALLVGFACEDKEQEKVYGCTDSTACNFNSDATIFDNSCYYATCELLGTWELSLVLTNPQSCMYTTMPDTLSGDTMQIDWLDFITFYEDSFYQCNTSDFDISVPYLDLSFENNYTGIYTIDNIYDKWSDKIISLDTSDHVSTNYLFSANDSVLVYTTGLFTWMGSPPEEGIIVCMHFVYEKSNSLLTSTNCQ